MAIILCPYELTRQAPVAMLAALLAPEPHTVRQSVLTWAPRSGIDPELDDAPLELLRAWSWSEPLWARGILAPVRLGDDLIDEVGQFIERWSKEPSLSPLADLLRSTRLTEIERDIARGGERPGIRILVTAMLESWVARTGAMWFAPSVGASRAPASREAPVVRFSLPLPLGGDGDLLLELRDGAAHALEPARMALSDIAREAMSHTRTARARAREILLPAAHDVADVFTALAPKLHDRAEHLGLPLRFTEAIVRADVVHPGRTLERAARALVGSPPPSPRGERVESTALALRPGLAISVRLSSWDASPGPGRSAGA